MFSVLIAPCFSQPIKIGVFYDFSITSVIMAPMDGNYIIEGDSSKIFRLNNEDIVFLGIDEDRIIVKSIDTILGYFKSVTVKGIDQVNSLKIKPVEPLIEPRVYHDDLLFTIKHNKFQVINTVALESYISGVVESEGGSKAHIEYYKTQAIICRTYSLENFERHIYEGFNLCDGVHCQVYKSRCQHNFEIVKATQSTAGLIIVDSTLSLITAAFHANCGGVTANSQDVWLKPKPYLESRIDTFCLNGRSAHWETRIPIEKWKKYLKNYGITFTGNEDGNVFTYKQDSRKTFYNYDKASLMLKDIRADWKLRSSFFSISADNDQLLFKGRGYGHGVGLCQDGAMRMAVSGYAYSDIIKYYYKNVYVVSLEALQFFKESSPAPEQE